MKQTVWHQNHRNNNRVKTNFIACHKNRLYQRKIKLKELNKKVFYLPANRAASRFDGLSGKYPAAAAAAAGERQSQEA